MFTIIDLVGRWVEAGSANAGPVRGCWSRSKSVHSWRGGPRRSAPLRGAPRLGRRFSPPLNYGIDSITSIEYRHSRKGAMNKFVCVSRLYPAKGVPGVLGIAVRDVSEIVKYAEAMSVNIGSKVLFTRITSVPDEFLEYLFVGDVICKFAGISEEYLDVLRPVETSVYKSTRHPVSIDWDVAEDVRTKAMMSYRWDVSLSKNQLCISDCKGSLAVARVTCNLRKMLLPAWELFKKKRTVASEQEIRAVWRTMRWIHGKMMAAGPDCSSISWPLFSIKIRAHFQTSAQIPVATVDNRTCTMMTRQKTNAQKMFWHKIRLIYLDDPSLLPDPFAFISTKKRVKQIAVTEEEAEQCLAYVDWDEWDTLRPPIAFKVRDMSTKQTRYKWK